MYLIDKKWFDDFKAVYLPHHGNQVQNSTTENLKLDAVDQNLKVSKTDSYCK
jgi:hypothetical protein